MKTFILLAVIIACYAQAYDTAMYNDTVRYNDTIKYNDTTVYIDTEMDDTAVYINTEMDDITQAQFDEYLKCNKPKYGVDASNCGILLIILACFCMGLGGLCFLVGLAVAPEMAFAGLCTGFSGYGIYYGGNILMEKIHVC